LHFYSAALAQKAKTNNDIKLVATLFFTSTFHFVAHAVLCQSF